MTVSELIEKLNALEDKDATVVVYDGECNDYSHPKLVVFDKFLVISEFSEDHLINWREISSARIKYCLKRN